jgi:acyl-CoA thioesterase-2
VPDAREVHSLHGYFLRSGDAEKPIVFTVDPIRDGKSFTTRRVVAVQDGKAIFNLAASFHIREPGFEHQTLTMPEVPAPDELLSERELGTRYLEKLPEAMVAQLPRAMRERVVAERPIEVRPVSPVDPLNPGTREAKAQVWFRANGELGDEAHIHHYLLAYASDFHLLTASMRPHAVSWLTPGMQVASLDHAMWFHRDFRMDEWLLYDIDSPTATGACGLARGRFFRRDGTLVATTMQEGLIRDRRG